MDIVEPDLSRVVPLFRALHNFHVALDSRCYHSDGADADHLAHFEAKRAGGGRIFAHDAGWRLASYVLAMPWIIAQDALRCGYRTVQVDHLYVSPEFREPGLGAQLVAVVEDWVKALGYDGWIVTYDAINPGAAQVYAAMGATPSKVISAKWIPQVGQICPTYPRSDNFTVASPAVISPSARSKRR
jgi:GNAT superfamily N-acetyltransferase